MENKANQSLEIRGLYITRMIRKFILKITSPKKDIRRKQKIKTKKIVGGSMDVQFYLIKKLNREKTKTDKNSRQSRSLMLEKKTVMPKTIIQRQ